LWLLFNDAMLEAEDGETGVWDELKSALGEPDVLLLE